MLSLMPKLTSSSSHTPWMQPQSLNCPLSQRRHRWVWARGVLVLVGGYHMSPADGGMGWNYSQYRIDGIGKIGIDLGEWSLSMAV